MIPYSRQTIAQDDIKAVVEVLKSDWLTQGPKVKEFEEALARYTGAGFCVVFSSGTAALQAAYFAAGIKKGDEVITSPLTFAATSNAALWQGAKVVFADVETASGNIDPKDVEKKITKKTKVITAVDYTGRPAKLDELKRIAKKRKFILIEDGCQALGASYCGKKAGSIADMTTFSFHPVKSITTGEGGAVTTNNKDFYESLLLFRSHGITKDPQKLLHKSPGDWYFEMQELGLNYRLTDIQSALGLSQLKRIERFVKARKAAAKRYYQKLSKVRNIILPPEDNREIKSSWHLFVIRLAGSLASKKAEVFAALRKAGIGVQVHHILTHLLPYYQKLGYRKGLCPRAETFYQGAISIPLYPDLSKKDQDFVIETLQRVLENEKTH